MCAALPKIVEEIWELIFPNLIRGVFLIAWRTFWKALMTLISLTPQDRSSSRGFPPEAES